MRAFEFLKESKDPVSNIVKNLEIVSQKTDENPDLLDTVEPALDELEQKIAELEAKTKQPPQQAPVAEDQATDLRIQNLEKRISNLKSKLSPDDPDLLEMENDLKNLLMEIKTVEKEIHPDTVFGKISDEFKAILAKRSDISPAVREVFIKELFDYIRVNKQTDLVKQFLNDCASGNGPIDMPNIVNTAGTGNLVEKSNPYFNILLKLAKTNPGSGNAASGQGEYMLVLAGKNTRKINPGDIGVDGVEKEKIEVKSSDLKGKSSYTDFVLSSDKLPVAQAKSYFVNEINKILGEQAIGSGTATSGGISALNDKTLKRLNPIFQKVNSKKPGAMKEIMKGLWKTVYPDSQLESYIDAVASAVNDDGTLELTKLYGPTAVLSAAAYKLSNQHDALLMLNIPDLSYIVVRDADEMSKIFQEGAVELGMTSIFDFRSNPGAPTFIKKFRQANKS